MLFLLRAKTVRHAKKCSLEKDIFQELICLLFLFFNIIIDSETVNSCCVNQDSKGCYMTKENFIILITLYKLSAPYLTGEVPRCCFSFSLDLNFVKLNAPSS